MNKNTSIQEELLQLENKQYAAFAKTFFKVQPKDSAGHRFLGIRVPQLRVLAKKHETISLEQIADLLCADFNEMRSLGLLILVRQYEKAHSDHKKSFYDFYIAHMLDINNWNLVDASAPYIVGHYLAGKDKKILLQWAKSPNLWVRRIAIVSTLYLIRQNDLTPTLEISQQLLNDDQDLIHKAVGWMLREVGKKNVTVLKQFIAQHYTSIPRTTLRYAIERFSPEERKKYLQGNIV